MKSQYHFSRPATYGLIALASCFIIGASFWYKSQYLKTVQPELSVTASSVTTSNIIKEKTSVYDVEVRSPVISKSFEGSEEATIYLQKLYTSRIIDFKKQAEESYSAAPKELLAENVASYYAVSFQEVASTSRYISLAVYTESYFIGMAHPSHDVDTFIFDKKLKKLVTLQDLFITSSSYSKVLSEGSRAFFDARNNEVGYDGLRIDITKENEGLSEGVSHFSKILPTDTGLVIYFNEYQIAPYVAGPQQAIIPYSVLKKIINENGVLEEYK